MYDKSAELADNNKKMLGKVVYSVRKNAVISLRVYISGSKHRIRISKLWKDSPDDRISIFKNFNI